MISFKELNESIKKDVILEKVIDSFEVKVDKNKYIAKIEKKGSSYVALVDNEKLDEFKSEKEARDAIDEFIQLLNV